MAVSAVIAAVSTATAYAGGTLFFSSIAAHFLITTAMGAALNALTPKPNVGAASGGYSLQGVSGAALDHQIIYGETRVGGVRIYDAATGDNNQTLNRIVAFAGHEIDSYQQIYLNDEVITLSGASVTAPERYVGQVAQAQYLGTDTQTADAGLITETAGLPLNEGRWTSAHRLQGIAYLYTKFVYDADAFPNGVPSVSAVIRGKKVYDPRTGTTAWSNNPALCLRDYLTSEYGLNQPADRIDDSLVIAAANICDQIVEGEKRYTCNGAFTTNAEPSAVATNILSSMGGLLWYGQGKWRIKAAAWTAPTVSFTEDDLRSSISLSTRHSRRDNFNSVKGTFRGPLSDWQAADYQEVTDPAFLAADNGLVNVLDFPLAFTSSSLTAQRIARIALNRNREQLTFSASFGMRAFQVQVGDFINITNERFGFVNKAFEVTEWTFGLTEGLDIQVRMTLREISEGVFTGADGSTFEQNNTTLPNPFAGLVINNLTASGGGRTQGDGTFINSAILDWDNISNAFLDYYEVEWKALSDSVYNATTTKQSDIELTPLVDGIEYIFRVRAVSASGIKGPYATVQFTGGGDVTAPSLPTDVTATGHFEYISIEWTNPADADLNFVEIWEADTNNSASATRVGISGGNTFQRTNLGISVTKYYFLKAVDYSGNASAFTTGVSATTTFIDDEDFANGIYSLFTEQGLYAIEDVTSLPVAGDFTGQKVFNRTDGKLYQWTGTVWELVVAAVEAPDISGQLQTAQIAVNAITNDLIAANAITETKISNDAITTPKIAAGAITAGEIAAGAVTATAIAANSITSANIVAGTIQANDIAAGTITANEIAGNTITANEIVANTITGGLLATSGIITNSAQINDALITSAKIGDAQVTNAKIGDTIQSNNFVAGSTGWRIQKTGDAEFNEIDVRGNITNLSQDHISGLAGSWNIFGTLGASQSITSLLSGAGYYSFILIGGGGGGGGSVPLGGGDNAVVSGGGGGGCAIFAFDWDGSTALNVTLGSGGAASTSAPASGQTVTAAAGGDSTFFIGGASAVVSRGGGGGRRSFNVGFAAGGSGGTVTDNYGSFFSFTGRTGGSGGNSSSITYGGGGGVNWLGNGANGGSVTSSGQIGAGGGPLGSASVTNSALYAGGTQDLLGGFLGNLPPFKITAVGSNALDAGGFLCGGRQGVTPIYPYRGGGAGTQNGGQGVLLWSRL